MKVVRLSAISTVRLNLPGNIPGTHFCQRLSQPQGRSPAGRITSLKNSNDTIRNLKAVVPHDTVASARSGLLKKEMKVQRAGRFSDVRIRVIL
jgi:hypothetical protein